MVWGFGVFSELVFVTVAVDDPSEPVARRLRGPAMVELSGFSSGRARLRLELCAPTILDRRWWWDRGRRLITLSTDHDHRHVRSSGWSLRWNPVHRCKTFRQPRGVGLFIVRTFKIHPSRKKPSRAATSQQASAFDKRSNPHRPRISLHEGFSRYCIPEQKGVIQNELNHVSSNIKDGLLLLRSPQCDAILSRNRNPPRPGYQALFPRGHCHQPQPFPRLRWSLPPLPPLKLF